MNNIYIYIYMYIYIYIYIYDISSSRYMAEFTSLKIYEVIKDITAQ